MTKIKILRHCSIINFSKDYFRQQYQRSCYQGNLARNAYAVSISKQVFGARAPERNIAAFWESYIYNLLPCQHILEN